MSELVQAVPKPHVENKAAIADFTELLCLTCDDGSISALDVSRVLGRDSDQLSDETIEQRVFEAFDELAERAKHCGNETRYPFELNEAGNVLGVTRIPRARDVTGVTSYRFASSG